MRVAIAFIPKTPTATSCAATRNGGCTTTPASGGACAMARTGTAARC